MRICAAWLSTARLTRKVRAIGFYERAVQLDPKFALALGAAFSLGRASILLASTRLAARRDAAKRALDNAQKLEPNLPKPSLPWVIINSGC